MPKRKVTIVQPRRVKAEKPEIFVRTVEEWPSRYAHASIRVKAGEYNYLVWRDGGRVRNFYLGKKKVLGLHTSPAREPGLGRRRAAAGPISVGQKSKKKAKV